MAWMIGRTKAIQDPEGSRAKALEKLRGLAMLDDPESVVVPILLAVKAVAGRAGVTIGLDELLGL